MIQQTIEIDVTGSRVNRLIEMGPDFAVRLSEEIEAGGPADDELGERARVPQADLRPEAAAAEGPLGAHEGKDVPPASRLLDPDPDPRSQSEAVR